MWENIYSRFFYLVRELIVTKMQVINNFGQSCHFTTMLQNGPPPSCSRGTSWNQ